MPLGGSDCSDGLARCVGGAVEVSRRAHVPDPCVGRPTECACPWDVVASCPHGCVADDLILDLSDIESITQLCALEEGEAVARVTAMEEKGSAPLTTPECAADDGDHVCVGGRVVRCAFDSITEAPRMRAVATCLRGCAKEGGRIGDEADDAQAQALLCARAAK
jgi:hypothetical protein